MSDNWQEWQHQDELERERQLDDILRAATYRALNDDEVEILAAEVGIKQHTNR